VDERRSGPTSEPPRLLHRSSQYGYTSNPAAALPGEPEAVDAATQRALTQSAHRRAGDYQRQAWAQASEAISRALSTLMSVRLDPSIASGVRVLERQRQRLDRDVGLHT
jgi:hypothetical protein